MPPEYLEPAADAPPAVDPVRKPAESPPPAGEPDPGHDGSGSDPPVAEVETQREPVPSPSLDVEGARMEQRALVLAPPPPQHPTAPPHVADDTYWFARGKGEQLVWKKEWRRFSWPNTMVMGVAGGVALVAAIVGPNEENPWRPNVPIDEDVRSALRGNTSNDRRFWRDVSDVLLSFSVAYPVVGEALIDAAWYRDSADVATELALIDAEAYTITLAYQQAAANFIGRERPYGRTCGTEDLDAQTNSCLVDNRYRSFFSGHTAITFASASLTCTHGAYLPLYGGDIEWLPCVLGYGLAAVTATTRIAGDMHYFTDVITGAAVGAFTGWFVPWLHYNTGIEPVGFKAGGATVTLLPTGTGLSASGVF